MMRLTLPSCHCCAQVRGQIDKRQSLEIRNLKLENREERIPPSTTCKYPDWLGTGELPGARQEEVRCHPRINPLAESFWSPLPPLLWAPQCLYPAASWTHQPQILPRHRVLKRFPIQRKHFFQMGRNALTAATGPRKSRCHWEESERVASVSMATADCRIFLFGIALQQPLCLRAILAPKQLSRFCISKGLLQSPNLSRDLSRF